MNIKHRTFCEQFVIDLNGTQAAIRTGYAESRAEVTASELLAREDVKNYIKELQKELSERTKIKAEDVINELAKIGFSDIRNYYDSGLNLKEITELKKSKSGAISSIKKTTTHFKEGHSEVIEFKLYDKVSALEKLGRHLGVFEKDNKQKEGVKILFKGAEPPEGE